MIIIPADELSKFNTTASISASQLLHESPQSTTISCSLQAAQWCDACM
jgi:hypothetical protein